MDRFTYLTSLVLGLFAAIAASAADVARPTGNPVSTATAPAVSEQRAATLRPPAVPLIACDPYFSVWSQSDRLTETATTHWTGQAQPLAALVRVDGHAYRLMGTSPEAVPALDQVSLTVLPTRTLYRFTGQGIQLELTFTTPALPDDIKILSRPTTYVNCEVRSTDHQNHQVEFYFDASGELSTDHPEQMVTGGPASVAGGVAVRLGSEIQQVLMKSGDDLRIDWGYLYVAASESLQPRIALGDGEQLRANFAKEGMSVVSGSEPLGPVQADHAAAAVALSLGEVREQGKSAYVLVAYDDLYSIEFMRHRLRPYWRKDGWQAADLIAAALKEHDSLEQRCAAFDERLMADLQAAGGDAYAQLGALAYRQCFAAGKWVADAQGQPLQFCKENHSNGCISTSDVFYPMAPQFLLFGPTLTKAFLVPFLEYAASDRWKFPFAPHDLGTYPKANGQVYGGGEVSRENQMPVEESGNLLLLCAALAKMEGNADFAGLYWKQLSQWAKYLRKRGFDPRNQLCTDDFAGHMAHSVNLSAKAICALGAYAQLCKLRGLDDEAAQYRQIAKEFAEKWVANARDGDHFKLAFDRPGTWSQKYNLVWDRLLGLGLFPDEVYQTEMAYYRRMQHEFGLPLDNRADYTKLDWILWTATLTGNRDDFETLVQPVLHFINQTPDRAPLTDWYFTSTAKKSDFTARPVIGGVFLRLLFDDKVWKSYASQDQTPPGHWARLPIHPQLKAIVPTAAPDGTYRFTVVAPPPQWYQVDFSDDSWQLGTGGLGTKETPAAPVGTEWSTADVWLRRTVELAEVPSRLALKIWHDESVEIYVNGKLIAELDGYCEDYESIEIPTDAWRVGSNVVAIHCHQNWGGQFIDFGLDALIEPPPQSTSP